MELAALALACLLPQDPPKKHKLAFEPKGELVIQFVEDQSWEYKDDDMKGTMRTELTLRWTFDGGKGKAKYDRVVYRGKGRKKGKDFDHDIEWTAKDGYVKGEGSEADRSWCAGEIKEELAK